MKHLILLLTFFTVTVLAGCQQSSQAQSQTTSQSKDSSEYFTKNGIEMERYTNKTDGYAITVPRSWGTYDGIAMGVFNDNLFDEMRKIGPPPFGKNAEDVMLNISVLSDEDNIRKPNQSWEDYYIETFIDPNTETYKKIAVASLPYKITEFITYNIGHDVDNKKIFIYQQRCRFIENEKKLYIFCYDKDNYIHRDIINSIELLQPQPQKNSEKPTEIEQYENMKYRYTISVPKSWGAYTPEGKFQENLYDEMTKVGPFGENRSDKNISIEILTNGLNGIDVPMESEQSWIDYFIKTRLSETKYDRADFPYTPYKITEFIIYNNDNSYRNTCRLTDNKINLYIFCYNAHNVDRNIIDSIELL